MASRILRAMYAAGLMSVPNTVTPVDTAAGQAVAQQVEEQGAVLLKNAGNQLPLDAATVGSIAVIGSHADIGVLSGGGSAQVYPTGGTALMEGYPTTPGWAPVIWDPSSPLKAIQAKAPNAKVQFDDGTNAARAAAVAGSAAAAIVFVSQWTSEGMDMPSLNFTDVIHRTPVDQDALVSAVAAANPHTIVVMENGGAQVMPWLRRRQRGAGGVVSRTTRRRSHRQHPVWGCQSLRQTARYLSRQRGRSAPSLDRRAGPAHFHRAVPGELLRRPAGGLQMVRREQPEAGVSVRLRLVLHQLRHRQYRGRQQPGVRAS